jgi:cell division protein FtsW (lipid II flippase)
MKAQFKITPINISAAIMGVILLLLVINQTDNFQQAAEEKLNPNNQFIQTGIAIGALGILLLIAILFYPFLLWKKQLYFGLIFSCISAIFFYDRTYFGQAISCN